MSTHRIVLTPAASVALVTTSDSHDRLNPGPQEPLRHWRVVVPALTPDGLRPGVTVEAQACPLTSGVAPLDSALGGKLYSWSWGIEGAAPVPSISTQVSPAKTSVASWTFDARHVGLWLLTCYRADNGAATIPLEVVGG